MDTEEGMRSPYVLLLQLQNHALRARVALKGRTRAEFRADAQVQTAVIAELQSMHEMLVAIDKTLNLGIRPDQFLLVAGLEANEKVPGGGPNLKKIYNFVHQKLPDLTAIIRVQLELMETAQDEEPYDEAEIPAEDDSEEQILVCDWGIGKPGIPDFANVNDRSFIFARPATFTSFDRRLHEVEFWKELEKQTGERMPPAQWMVYQAIECDDDEKKIAMLHRALDTSKGCADAYVLLAEESMTSVEEELDLYQKALAAAERSLGPGGMQKNAGHFWSDFRTRPYMRARAGLAMTLYDDEQYEAAFGHWSALLDLNPDDHQGIREWMILGLLEQRRLDQAEVLHQRYKDQPSGLWAWSRALLDFLKSGDSQTARISLAAAKGVNPYVPGFLLERRKLPKPRPDLYTLGSEDEAIDYIDRADLGWHDAPGAVEWVKSQEY